MDINKSRKFYQERYIKAIMQFGDNSLTAIICRKKLALLDKKSKQRQLLNADELALKGSSQNKDETN